jgi:uncharacterized glyoxalase superfamily protein PhnB
MSGWAVIPSIRVKDMEAALSFYRDLLGFEVERNGSEVGNAALVRGDARIMLETSAGFYSASYNAAIEERLGARSSIALYMEAMDLDDLYRRIVDAGVPIEDPLAEREWGQREFTVADPDGLWLTFWQAIDPNEEAAPPGTAS